MFVCQRNIRVTSVLRKGEAEGGKREGDGDGGYPERGRRGPSVDCYHYEGHQHKDLLAPFER